MVTPTTTEAPQPGIAYRFERYMWLAPGKLGLVYHPAPEPLPWRGDWLSARRKNPTLRRSVAGDTIDARRWPANAWMEPDKIEPLPRAEILKLALNRASELGASPAKCTKCPATDTGACSTCQGFGTFFDSRAGPLTAVEVCLKRDDRLAGN